MRRACANQWFFRGQYYGIAAAVGKFGAFAGSYALDSLQRNAPTETKAGQYPFWVASSLAMFAGVLAIVALPKIGQDTIDFEDLRFRAYLAEKGYDTTKMGLGEKSLSDGEAVVEEEKGARG